MATSTSAPGGAPFPSRPYTSGLGRSTPYNAQQQTPFAPPTQTQQQQPTGAYTGFGGGLGRGAGADSGATQQQREAQRLERERIERAERERREAEERGALDALSEEQREEVNEAVRLTTSASNRADAAAKSTRPTANTLRSSSHSSIWIVTRISTTTSSA